MSSSVSEVGNAATPRLSAHLTLVRNAVSLYGSTIVTSALGFAFWYLVARRFAPAEAGYASAVVSAMQLLATFCVVGLNTLLISELSRDRSLARPLLATALLCVSVVGGVVAVGTAVVLGHASATFSAVLGSPVATLVFALGVAVTAVTLLVDDACIGLLHGELQLGRNTVFAVVRLLLVPLAALLWPYARGMQIYSAWVAAAAVSVVLLLVRLARVTPEGSWRPHLDLVRRHRGVALQHHWLNIAMATPRLTTPVIAALLLGPSAAAAFYAASLMVSFVNILPAHLTTALFALRPGDHTAMRRSVRFTMSVSAALAAASAPAIWLGSGFALRLFRPEYLVAHTAMLILALTTLPAALMTHYIAISRVNGTLARAAAVTTAGAVLEVAAACCGASLAGVTGLAAGLLAAQVLVSAAVVPVVLRALRRPAEDVTG